MDNNLLEQVLQLMETHVEGVTFRRGWQDSWGSRLLEGPVVCGEIASQKREGVRVETVLRFSLFAPQERQREEVAASLDQVIQTYCLGCSSSRWERVEADSLARLPSLVLELTFQGATLTPQGTQVVLGGKSYTAAGYSVEVSLSGEEITAVGEDVPFAVKEPRIEYRVELRGVAAQGLERMAVFTAQVGESTFTGCRWKTLDTDAATAVFIASGCQGKEEP